MVAAVVIVKECVQAPNKVYVNEGSTII